MVWREDGNCTLTISFVYVLCMPYIIIMQALVRRESQCHTIALADQTCGSHKSDSPCSIGQNKMLGMLIIMTDPWSHRHNNYYYVINHTHR